MICHYGSERFNNALRLAFAVRNLHGMRAGAQQRHRHRSCRTSRGWSAHLTADIVQSMVRIASQQEFEGFLAPPEVKISRHSAGARRPPAGSSSSKSCNSRFEDESHTCWSPSSPSRANRDDRTACNPSCLPLTPAEGAQGPRARSLGRDRPSTLGFRYLLSSYS